MELLQLQYFAEVARMESFTKAAQSLHISQPALSQTVKRLENELGVKLFDREGKHIHLTSSGRMFYDRIAQSLWEIQSAYNDLNTTWIQGNITIGTYMPVYPILDCIKAFSLANPDITFSFFYMIDSSSANARSLDALLHYSISDTLGFNESIPLGTVHGNFVVPKEFPVEGRTELRLNELRKMPFVSLSREDGWVEEVFRNFSHSGSIPNIRYRTNNSLIKQEILEAGLAYGSSNNMLTRHFSNTGNYHILPHSDQDSCLSCAHRIGIYMAWWNTDYLSPAARALKQFCIEWFSEKSHLIGEVEDETV